MNRQKIYAFYKPYGILSQFTAENPACTLANFNLPKDVYAAGRLDRDSEGLLILTNDGPFIKLLSDPRFDKEKTYHVQVEKIPSQIDLDKLCNGLRIEDYITKKCKAKLLIDTPAFPERIPPIRERKTIPTAWIEIILTEGKNRQIRKMTAAIGFPTLRLVRVKIGKLSIGNLSPGEFREITREDIV